MKSIYQGTSVHVCAFSSIMPFQPNADPLPPCVLQEPWPRCVEVECDSAPYIARKAHRSLLTYWATWPPAAHSVWSAIRLGGERAPVRHYRAETFPPTLRAVHGETAIHQPVEYRPAGAPLEPATGPGQTPEETSLSKQALQEAPCPTGERQRGMKEMQGVIWNTLSIEEK